MDHLPSPAKAERNQRRKLEFLPPVWPLVAGLILIALVAVLVSR
jgi:hypothetical protein